MKPLVEQWYSPRPALWCLPFSWLFYSLVVIRRALYKARILPSQSVPVPVIVVGNISVGGTGKTPVVAWLVKLLRAAGYSPGIVTRGYGGQAERWPQQVRAD
ncbi:tetraacyldisaccharide 4'-kinase [Pseudomonadota bacterium]